MPADIDFHCDRADFARKSIAAAMTELKKREGVALLSLANLRQIAALPKNDAPYSVSEYWEAFDAIAINEFGGHIIRKERS